MSYLQDNPVALFSRQIHGSLSNDLLTLAQGDVVEVAFVFIKS